MADALLTIDNIVKRFGDTTILDGISFSVKKSEVIGPSGCGKSTLLRCINALEPIQEGSITLDGDVIERNSKTLPLLRQRIGMVFQSYDLFPHLTVLDNILLAPCKVQKRDKEEVKQEAMSLLERVGLKEKAKSYPRELSGGQKQRLSIARVFLKDPAILILDEATSSIDAKTEKELQKGLQELLKGRTSFIIAHRLSTIKNCDKIMFISNKGITEAGTHDELMAKKGDYYKLCMAQK